MSIRPVKVPDLLPDGRMVIQAPSHAPGTNVKVDGVITIDQSHPEYDYWYEKYQQQQRRTPDPRLKALFDEVTYGIPSPENFDMMLSGELSPEGQQQTSSPTKPAKKSAAKDQPKSEPKTASKSSEKKPTEASGKVQKKEPPQKDEKTRS